MNCAPGRGRVTRFAASATYPHKLGELGGPGFERDITRSDLRPSPLRGSSCHTSRSPMLHVAAPPAVPGGIGLASVDGRDQPALRPTHTCRSPPHWWPR